MFSRLFSPLLQIAGTGTLESRRSSIRRRVGSNHHISAVMHTGVSFFFEITVWSIGNFVRKSNIHASKRNHTIAVKTPSGNGCWPGSYLPIRRGDIAERRDVGRGFEVISRPNIEPETDLESRRMEPRPHCRSAFEQQLGCVTGCSSKQPLMTAPLWCRLRVCRTNLNLCISATSLWPKETMLLLIGNIL